MLLTTKTNGKHKNKQIGYCIVDNCRAVKYAAPGQALINCSRLHNPLRSPRNIVISVVMYVETMATYQNIALCFLQQVILNKKLL
jgi:hypothetical protein